MINIIYHEEILKIHPNDNVNIVDNGIKIQQVLDEEEMKRFLKILKLYTLEKANHNNDKIVKIIGIFDECDNKYKGELKK